MGPIVIKQIPLCIYTDTFCMLSMYYVRNCHTKGAAIYAVVFYDPRLSVSHNRELFLMYQTNSTESYR